MDSPMVRATWQAGVLSAISNIIGQTIQCYREREPFVLNTTDLFHFVLFAMLACPPNFAWQNWLESKFPKYPSRGRGGASRIENSEDRLSITNTLIKLGLDQTISASINTIGFIAGIALLRGRSIDATLHECREKFPPVMLAGWKLWPAVSLSSFLFVPVEFRTTFGGIVGLFWYVERSHKNWIQLQKSKS